MRRLLPIFVLSCFSTLSLAQEVIRDPLPNPVFTDEAAIQLEPFATIPGSPGFGNPARMNMLKEAPDGSGRLFVIDQRGFLYAIESDGTVGLYLAIRDFVGSSFMSVNGRYGQDGWTSFAFHPEFATNGRFYTIASVATSTGTPDFLAKRPINAGDGISRQPTHHDVLQEWTASDPGGTVFEGTVREVMRIEQPFGDHNVGELTFNPNAGPGDADYGLLYMAVADGGNVFPIINADPLDNGQDTTVIHGKIVRIDPLGANSANGKYGIPDDNPWALTDGPELDEIWAYGFRNPHRINFDTGGSRDLYAYGIGQWFIEEVNRVQAGGNYGWGNREGSFVLEDTSEFELYAIPADEEPGTFQYPVLQYDHPGTAGSAFSGTGAISGGFIYRGTEMPRLYGKMVFADFTSNGRTFVADSRDFADLGPFASAPLFQLPVHSASGSLSTLPRIIRGSDGERTDVRFSRDLSDNLYLLNKHNGVVYRVVAAPDEPTWAEWLFSAAEIDGVLESPWFGVIGAESWPWILHETHGWVAMDIESALPGEVVYLDQDLGWIYANASFYPWLYLMETGDWAYYFEETSAPRWLWYATSGTWAAVGD